MLDSKPYFYVDYMIPLLEKVFKLMLMQFYNQPIRGRGLGANERVEFENEPCALYILKAKSFCFDFRVVLASPDHTNPNPIMIWNSFISLMFYSAYVRLLSDFFCRSIFLDELFYVLGRTLGFSYTDSEYNYGATKIIFPIINQKI